MTDVTDAATLTTHTWDARRTQVEEHLGQPLEGRRFEIEKLLFDRGYPQLLEVVKFYRRQADGGKPIGNRAIVKQLGRLLDGQTVSHATLAAWCPPDDPGPLNDPTPVHAAA